MTWLFDSATPSKTRLTRPTPADSAARLGDTGERHCAGPQGRPEAERTKEQAQAALFSGGKDIRLARRFWRSHAMAHDKTDTAHGTHGSSDAETVRLRPGRLLEAEQRVGSC